MKHDREAIRKRLEALKKHVCGEAMKEIYGLVEDLTGIDGLATIESPLPIGSEGRGIEQLCSSMKKHIQWRLKREDGCGEQGDFRWKLEVGAAGNLCIVFYVPQLRWDNP